MTAETLAAALLRDVERYPTFNGRFMYEDAVLAALSRALDPALTERAGEMVPKLTTWEGESETLDAAADLITALLAQNAALRAEAQEMGAGMVTLSHELSMERARAEAAEAERERLEKHIEDTAKDTHKLLVAAEAKVEKLRGALMVARAHVANNAEGWSVSRGAARVDLTIVDAALTTEEGK